MKKNITSYLAWKATYAARASVNYKIWLERFVEICGTKKLTSYIINDVVTYHLWLSKHFSPYSVQKDAIEALIGDSEEEENNFISDYLELSIDGLDIQEAGDFGKQFYLKLIEEIKVERSKSEQTSRLPDVVNPEASEDFEEIKIDLNILPRTAFFKNKGSEGLWLVDFVVYQQGAKKQYFNVTDERMESTRHGHCRFHFQPKDADGHYKILIRVHGGWLYSTQEKEIYHKPGDDSHYIIQINMVK